jgi:hypothetical protein
LEFIRRCYRLTGAGVAIGCYLYIDAGDFAGLIVGALFAGRCHARTMPQLFIFHNGNSGIWHITCFLYDFLDGHFAVFACYFHASP